MGSITSRPKVPAATSPATITVPVAAPSPETSTPAPAEDAPEPVHGDEDLKAEARNMGLLGRSRGRLSTILTGFRGVLGQSNNQAQRKTLLGD